MLVHDLEAEDRKICQSIHTSEVRMRSVCEAYRSWNLTIEKSANRYTLQRVGEGACGCASGRRVLFKLLT
jgi:hypothetical protein